MNSKQELTIPITLKTNYLLPCYRSAFNLVFIKMLEREISKQSPLLQIVLDEKSSDDPGKSTGSVEEAIAPTGDRLKRQYVECKLECNVSKIDVKNADLSGLIEAIEVQAKDQAAIMYPHIYNSLIDQGVLTELDNLVGVTGSELIDRMLDNLEKMDIAFHPDGTVASQFYLHEDVCKNLKAVPPFSQSQQNRHQQIMQSQLEKWRARKRNRKLS